MVDVDVEPGLVKVVALDTAQDVGKAINPDSVVGKIHDGSAQGLGLALMEEVVVTDGQVRNPSFTDYLLPTILDMPAMQVQVLEHADPHAPYGVGRVREPDESPGRCVRCPAPGHSNPPPVLQRKPSPITGAISAPTRPSCGWLRPARG